MNELYKLLKQYNNKELDKDFFEKAFAYFLNEDEGLFRFVNKIKVTDADEENETLGNYRMEEEMITIYLNNIKDNQLDKKQINNRNILGLQVLKHEIIHAENLRKIREGKRDIKTYVKMMGLLDYCAKKGIYYPLETDLSYLHFLTKENYLTDPNERTTDIESWKYIVNLLKNQKNTEELLYARSRLYYALIRGYKDNGIYINSPTYEFLLELRQIREFNLVKKRVEGKNYNFDTRLTCGLPITKDEYYKKILQKTRLQKRRKT